MKKKLLFFLTLLTVAALAANAPIVTDGKLGKVWTSVTGGNMLSTPSLGIYNGTTLLPFQLSTDGSLATTVGGTATPAPVVLDPALGQAFITLGVGNIQALPMLGVYNGTTLLPINVDAFGNVETTGGGGGGGTPGGNNTDVQFNAAGSFAGSDSLTWNGSALTGANFIDSGLTASTAVVANGSKQLASSSTTSTELGFVHGVTSAIQTQINAIAPGTPHQSLQFKNGTAFAGSKLVTPDAGVSFYNTQFSEGYLENLFTNSGNFPAGPWIAMFGNQTNNQTDPNGFTKAVKYQFSNHQVDCFLYNWGSPTGVPYNASAWIKGQSGGEQIFFGTIKDESGTTGSIDALSGPITATTSFVRYNLNFTPTGAAVYFGFCEKSSSDTITIFGPQLSATLTTAGAYTPTSNLQPLVGNGISATFAQIDTLFVNNPLPKLLFPLVAGVGCTSHDSAYWNTADNNFQVCDNSGTSHQVAYAEGTHGIDSVGQFILSNGTTTLSDAAITPASIITDSISSASQPGVLQYSCSSGSCTVQSYNTGFAGTNSSDNSTYNYVVQH